MPAEALVRANSNVDDAIDGTTTSNLKNAVGALNTSTKEAVFPGGNAVFGVTTSPKAAGGFFANNSNKGVGVQGNGPESGVSGYSKSGVGVRGYSSEAVGVEGTSNSASQSAVFGINTGAGVAPAGLNRPAGAGVWGHTKVEKGAGIVGSVEPGLTQAAGVTGIGPIAGHFFGDVIVTGDVQLTGADLAEHFDIADGYAVEPGTVMVLDTDGVRVCTQDYDTRVVGVISGAGCYKPGLVLDKQQTDRDRRPLALVGKVYCMVDASSAPIREGDLLTTSTTPGHAMKAADPARAFGSVLGKAMAALDHGTGLLPVLVLLR